MGRDNRRRSVASAFRHLSDNAQRDKRVQIEVLLARNIDMIANLKTKIYEVERDNGRLANHNEELREFSLDGYQIATNAEAIGNEREKLSFDLADKAKIIKQLH